MITVTRPRHPVLIGCCLAMLATSIALLVAGHFFSWNDPEGDQSLQWNDGYGTSAALLALAGALTSLWDRAGRQLTGIVVLAFVGVLVAVEAVAPHFTFVGTSDGSGMAVWEVLLAMAAFVLATPRWTRAGSGSGRRSGRRRLTTWGRWSLYLVAFVPVSWVVVSAMTAATTWAHPECGGPGGACMEDYAGFIYGVFVIAALVVVVVAAEVVAGVTRLRRRRRAG